MTTLETEATTAALAGVHEFVRASALEAGFAEDDLARIDLVAEEIFINIARYAYPEGVAGPVRIRCFQQASGLTVEFADDGAPFNPLDADPPVFDVPLEERPIGGLGLFLIRELTASLEYERRDGANVLRFVYAGS